MGSITSFDARPAIAMGGPQAPYQALLPLQHHDPDKANPVHASIPLLSPCWVHASKHVRASRPLLSPCWVRASKHVHASRPLLSPCWVRASKHVHASRPLLSPCWVRASKQVHASNPPCHLDGCAQAGAPPCPPLTLLGDECSIQGTPPQPLPPLPAPPCPLIAALHMLLLPLPAPDLPPFICCCCLQSQLSNVQTQLADSKKAVEVGGGRSGGGGDASLWVALGAALWVRLGAALWVGAAQVLCAPSCVGNLPVLRAPCVSRDFLRS